MTKRNVPVYNGTLRNHSIRLPHCIRECSGIRIFGMRIKSIAFTTDVAIIKNINADAVIAVYPFTPQPTISQAIIGISDVPVFVGVGGGITGGDRAVRLAIEAENQGAFGVVVNAPISDEVISRIIISACQVLFSSFFEAFFDVCVSLSSNLFTLSHLCFFVNNYFCFFQNFSNCLFRRNNSLRQLS